MKDFTTQKTEHKIIFMGTADFSVLPLEKLNEKFDIELVVTKKG